jgi:hypothetical protein
MSKVNENMSPAITAFQNRDHMRGIPFYGEKGDFNFVVGKSQFTPGVSIKLLPLSDMSRNGDPGIGDFDRKVSLIKYYYKPGDRVRGILVNSHLKSDEGRIVVGKLNRVEINRRDNTIKVFIKNPETLEIQEIYVDTMERLYESKIGMALNFSEFIGS